MKKRYLVLEDGTVYTGTAFGADVQRMGELVFTTGVVGYLENLTDPNYYGQIVMQTFPLAGNYGIIEEDFAGPCQVSGYVAREWCQAPSNFRCQYDLDKYLKDNGVPGICGVDTREITKKIREEGVMNALLCDEVPAVLNALKDYSVHMAVASTTVSEAVVYPAEGKEKYRVTMLDCGSKALLLQGLTQRGCTVTLVPASTPAEEILSTKPDGVVLSGGPGDPKTNPALVEEVKKLYGQIPLMAVGLGHQLLALATGADTVKLKYGHRTGNQPVKDVNGVRTYITNQNHGYTVVAESVREGKVSFVNLNDKTCEGIDYPAKAFSLQFVPEVGFNSHDTSYLYDRFVTMMEEDRNAVR